MGSSTASVFFFFCFFFLDLVEFSATTLVSSPVDLAGDSILVEAAGLGGTKSGVTVFVETGGLGATKSGVS